MRLHGKFCHQGVDLINSFLEVVFPSTKINMERSTKLFARGDLFVGSGKRNGKSMGILVFLHK